MAVFYVHEAKTQFSRLLDLVIEGETIVITRNGVPVAELVPARKKVLQFGAGCNDPDVNPRAGDDWWQPMSDDEVDTFIEGRG